MKLIVGLGNPDTKYQMTRHNLGFMVVQALAEKEGVGFRKSPVTDAMIAKVEISSQHCSLLLPLTYMNNSGMALKAVIARSGIDLKDILVVYDDMAIGFGQMRVRPDGSAGGHNGIASIIEHLGSKDFARIRLGIGRPKFKDDAVDYVLGKFTLAEQKILPDLINQALVCIHSWMDQGIETAMNQFNSQKELKNE